jgi:hypothetical protein
MRRGAGGYDFDEASSLEAHRLSTGGSIVDHHKEHPASPEQREHGFETGQDRKPDTTDEEDEGRFSEGQERLPETPEKEKHGRSSAGEEETPDSPEKSVERRFSEGQERKT